MLIFHEPAMILFSKCDYLFAYELVFLFLIGLWFNSTVGSECSLKIIIRMY